MPQNSEQLLPWELPLPSIVQEMLQVLESRRPGLSNLFHSPEPQNVLLQLTGLSRL